MAVERLHGDPVNDRKGVSSGHPLRHIIAILLLMSSGCGGGGPPAVRPLDEPLGNPIFPGAIRILVATPGSGCVVGTQPTFTWTVTGQRIVYVGLFRSNIAVRDGRIVNTEDNIWAWHSGLGTAREGNVPFGAGRDVINGVLQMDRPPTTLDESSTYVWAVWAWDELGRAVTHSSLETFFVVNSGAVTCP